MSEPIEAKTAWVLGWEAGASTVTGILTELITELRKQHPTGTFYNHYVEREYTGCAACTNEGEYPCIDMVTLENADPCPTLLELDRVEARLKGLNDE